MNLRPLALAFTVGFATALALPAAQAAGATSTTTPLPSDSVMQLGDTFTDQAGRAFTLAARRGHPQLVAMFYTSCQYVCPLIVQTGQGIDHALTPAERAKLRVLMISLDPARDTPAALMKTATERKVDLARWTLARTDDEGVRKTAALLGVRYRKLANGEFNHSSAIILLDADGRIVARTEQLGATPDPEFLAKVRATLH